VDAVAGRERAEGASSRGADAAGPGEAAAVRGEGVTARGVVAALPAAEGVAFALYRHVPQEMVRISAIEGLEGLRARPEVERVVLYRGPGTEVDWRVGTESAIFEVTGHVADHQALLELRRVVEHEVVVRGERRVRPVSLTSRAIGALHTLATLPLVGASGTPLM
jgi:hypothetical protein